MWGFPKNGISKTVGFNSEYTEMVNFWMKNGGTTIETSIHILPSVVGLQWPHPARPFHLLDIMILGSSAAGLYAVCLSS